MFDSRRLSAWAIGLFALTSPIMAEDAPAPAASGGWRPVVQGRLANGLRYAILPRTANEPGIGVLLRIEGGFLAERRPGERGLAHLLEHILIVSPTTGAPDDLYHFPRVGLRVTFEAPSVGTTTWRETNYFVSTRTNDPAAVDTMLALFRESVSELTFRSDAVDGQRADVMREMTGRKLGNDIYAKYIAAVAPGSPTDAIDGQNSDDVPTASVATLRGLYHRLYRPENATIVIVGAVDAMRIKALVEQRFGAWRGVGPRPPRTAVPTFRADRIAPISYSDLAQGRRTAMMTAVMLTPAPAATRQRQARAALMDMAMTRAVTTLLPRPDSAAGQTGMFIENGEQGHRLVMLWNDFAADGWRPALAGLATTTCRLGTIGLSERAWAAAKQDVIDELERRTAGMAAVPNVEVAKDLSHAVAAGRALLPPDELLREGRRWFPSVDREASVAWWRDQWQARRGHIRVEAPELSALTNPVAAIRTVADDAVEDARCKVRR